MINTAGGLQGLIGLMLDAGPEEIKGYVPPASSAAERMLAQIMSQKDLAAAERGDLQPRPEELSSVALLREVAGIFAAHEVAKGKTVALAQGLEDIRLRTDRTLLSRSIGNLPRTMPEDSRLQVFQRSFSTKGAGRGLGTYSIRLLTEKYLGGKVSFVTGPEGTTFRAEYPVAA